MGLPERWARFESYLESAIDIGQYELSMNQEMASVAVFVLQNVVISSVLRIQWAFWANNDTLQRNKARKRRRGKQSPNIAWVSDLLPLLIIRQWLLASLAITWPQVRWISCLNSRCKQTVKARPTARTWAMINLWKLNVEHWNLRCGPPEASPTLFYMFIVPSLPHFALSHQSLTSVMHGIKGFLLWIQSTTWPIRDSLE